MSVLVTGGAGYIGSHVVRLLRERGDEVVVVDRLSDGRADRIEGLPLASIDLARDEAPELLRSFIDDNGVTAVVHLAALKQAGQSVEQPARYYRENLGGLANLLTAIENTSVTRMVFSSSAAVYGNPLTTTVGEETVAKPINPYGETKLAGEWLVAAAAAALGIKAISLRYFNVAGAGWPELGDRIPLNLLTIAIDAVKRGDRPTVFGTDYDTPDGTGIRDYVHVLDLADAHRAALDHLATSDAETHRVFNVGTGTGASVLEVFSELVAVSGVRFEPRVAGRRPGDPAAVIADISRITEEMGWRAQHGLSDMVGSAWEASRYGE